MADGKLILERLGGERGRETAEKERGEGGERGRGLRKRGERNCTEKRERERWRKGTGREREAREE